MIKSQTTKPVVRNNTNPVYVHDCNCCTFLGGAIVNKQMVDYYKCDDTLIARFGDEPQENKSLPEWIVKRYATHDAIWAKAIKITNV